MTPDRSVLGTAGDQGDTMTGPVQLGAYNTADGTSPEDQETHSSVSHGRRGSRIDRAEGLVVVLRVGPNL